MRLGQLFLFAVMVAATYGLLCLAAACDAHHRQALMKISVRIPLRCVTSDITLRDCTGDIPNLACQKTEFEHTKSCEQIHVEGK
jgi:hypothetical protein